MRTDKEMPATITSYANDVSCSDARKIDRIPQGAEEKSKDKKLPYTGLMGILPGFEIYVLQNSR